MEWVQPTDAEILAIGKKRTAVTYSGLHQSIITRPKQVKINFVAELHSRFVTWSRCHDIIISLGMQWCPTTIFISFEIKRDRVCSKTHYTDSHFMLILAGKKKKDICWWFKTNNWCKEILGFILKLIPCKISKVLARRLLEGLSIHWMVLYLSMVWVLQGESKFWGLWKNNSFLWTTHHHLKLFMPQNLIFMHQCSKLWPMTLFAMNYPSTVEPRFHFLSWV